MGAFAGMNDATRGYTSNFLRPGRYVVRIDGSDSFEKEGVGRMWKNTLTVLAVEDGDHKVGEEVHTFFKLDPRYPKMFYGKIMAFIAGVLDVSDDEVGETETEQVLSDENPLLGLVTVVTARETVSKKPDEQGNPRKFTNYSWSPSLTDEEIVAAIGEEGVARFFPNGLEG